MPAPQSTPDTVERLETLFKGIVLDNLFTRKHLRVLRKLIDRVQKGELEGKYLIGFLSTDRNGAVLPEHYGAAGTLWKFVTEEMYDLLKAKYGTQEGMEIYHRLFRTFLDGEGLVNADGTVNLNFAEALIGQLENVFSEVEQTVFVPSLETTAKYLHESIQKINAQIPIIQDAIENNSGVLPNGRKVSQEALTEMREKIIGYEDALTRLGFTRNDIGKLMLNGDESQAN